MLWTGDINSANPARVADSFDLVDPRDPKHMYFGTGSAGVFGVETIRVRTGSADAGMLSPSGPDRIRNRVRPALHDVASAGADLLYQQNHSVFLPNDRPEARWVRIGDNMPREVR